MKIFWHLLKTQDAELHQRLPAFFRLANLEHSLFELLEHIGREPTRAVDNYGRREWGRLGQNGKAFVTARIKILEMVKGWRVHDGGFDLATQDIGKSLLPVRGLEKPGEFISWLAGGILIGKKPARKPRFQNGNVLVFQVPEFFNGAPSADHQDSPKIEAEIRT